MSNYRQPDEMEIGALLRALSVLLLIAASAWLLLSDYHPMSLAFLISVYFCAYVAFRLMCGYELLIPLATFETLPDLGKTVSLLVHTAVREDAIQLFGFATSLEKELFHLLLRASRVGPKLAQSILSGMEPERLLQRLREADAKGLRKAPGVGPKLAERIAVELRDDAEKLALRLGASARMSGSFDTERVDPAEELLSALTNLGYPPAQAGRVVEAALAEASAEASLEDLIRVALRRMAN